MLGWGGRGDVTLRFRLASAAVIGLVALAFAGSASAVTYRSPGYKGKLRFGKVVPQPLPPITLGTGKYPNLLVDRGGDRSHPVRAGWRHHGAGHARLLQPAARHQELRVVGDGAQPESARTQRRRRLLGQPALPQPRLRRSRSPGHRQPAVRRRAPLPGDVQNAERDGLRQQRVRVELGRRRRDHHRPGPDRRQPDGRGRDRLRRPGRSLGRHDQRHRDRRHVLPGQPRRQIHDRQGAARHGRSGLLREPRARLEHAGARAGGGVRRPERQRVRARVERSGRRQRRLHLVDGVVPGLPAADRRRRQRRVRALQRQLAERRQPAAATDSGRSAGRRAGGARQVDHAAGDLRGSDRADSASPTPTSSV